MIIGDAINVEFWDLSKINRDDLILACVGHRQPGGLYRISANLEKMPIHHKNQGVLRILLGPGTRV